MKPSFLHSHMLLFLPSRAFSIFESSAHVGLSLRFCLSAFSFIQPFCFLCHLLRILFVPAHASLSLLFCLSASSHQLYSQLPQAFSPSHWSAADGSRCMMSLVEIAMLFSGNFQRSQGTLCPLCAQSRDSPQPPPHTSKMPTRTVLHCITPARSATPHKPR